MVNGLNGESGESAVQHVAVGRNRELVRASFCVPVRACVRGGGWLDGSEESRQLSL